MTTLPVAVDQPPSWRPVDMAAVLASTEPLVVPTLFPRDDGVFLIYPGLVHSFHGESESGKSLLLQWECARLLRSGAKVLYLDFESDAHSLRDRLLVLGATPSQILDGFTYVRPDADPRSEGERAAFEALCRGCYNLIVIDGVTDALGIYGYSTKDNDEVSAWMRDLPRRLAASTGAAVALVDHVTKDVEGRGRHAIGAQAKMASLTGAAFLVEVKDPIGIGMVGALELWIGKDRPGQIRQHCGRTRGRMQLAATVQVDGRGVTTTILVLASGRREDQDRPVSAMETLKVRVSRAVEESAEPLTKTAIKNRVAGRTQEVLTAVDELVASGHLTRVQAGSAQLHSSRHPFQPGDANCDLKLADQLVTVNPAVAIVATPEPETVTEAETGSAGSGSL
ncbi:MAG: AAA family ATPase [Jatrophihabitans sp.]|uniref:AAA family ATPase n=1 Tax=Jatrophihabitans sp. TaxID=1932789 RepID=UPI003F7E8D2B